jgi:hypothetical protein
MSASSESQPYGERQDDFPIRARSAEARSGLGAKEGAAEGNSGICRMMASAHHQQGQSISMNIPSRASITMLQRKSAKFLRIWGPRKSL